MLTAKERSFLMKKISVLIVEDDPMARNLLEIYIKNSENYELVQSIESAAMAEIYCMSKKIDLILMDVCTAMNANGLDAAEKIKRNYPTIKIIIITSLPEFSFLKRAKKIGVDSFWYKNATAQEILDVMNRTMNGENIFPDATPTLKLGNAVNVEFSERELQVLKYVVAGETDAVIAEKMNISLRTVKGHIQSMRDKTGFKNRTELAVRARECGFVIAEEKN